MYYKYDVKINKILLNISAYERMKHATVMLTSFAISVRNHVNELFVRVSLNYLIKVYVFLTTAYQTTDHY